MAQAERIGNSIAPYKYRLLPTTLAGLLGDMFGISTPLAFVLLNITVITATALLFTQYLTSNLGFSKALATVGALLFITLASVTGTVSFPMLEPSSMLFAILIFMAVVRQSSWLFLISSTLGVLTKEIFIFSSIMWLIEKREARGLALLKSVLICSTPALAFVAIRLLLGDAPLTVNYGFNIAAGELPSYGNRLLSLSGLKHLILTSFLSFVFLWLGIANIRSHDFLRRQSVIIPIVLLATFLLSSRVTRVLGVLFPLIIPMFLLYLAPYFKSDQETLVTSKVESPTQ